MMGAFRRQSGPLWHKREQAVAKAAELRRQGYDAAIKEERGGWAVYVSSNRSSDLRHRE